MYPATHSTTAAPLPSDIRRVLLGTDLGRTTERATDRAFDLAKRHGAAQGLVARGREIGVNVTFLVWTGDPGESIVSAAEAENVDLVVVGTHGRGTIGRLLLGSVSEHVVRNAPCPVLVIRPASAGRAGPRRPDHVGLTMSA